MQHPSATDGLFEPAVALGAMVQVGDVLGSVSDFLGERAEVVRAQEDGVVLMLRAFNRVIRGDALAAIASAARRVEGWRDWQ